MNRILATSVALIATTIFVPTASAMAQNREAEIRFESAQRRFDGELAMFKAEVERYERARPTAAQPAAVLAAALPPARAESPIVARDDVGREPASEPRAIAPAPAPDPVERDEPEDRPPL